MDPNVTVAIIISSCAHCDHDYDDDIPPSAGLLSDMSHWIKSSDSLEDVNGMLREIPEHFMVHCVAVTYIISCCVLTFLPGYI